MARRSLRSVSTRHITGIESPRCDERLPSHISKPTVSTVSGCNDAASPAAYSFETVSICSAGVLLGRPGIRVVVI
jgi:hypothetical protein